MLGCAWQERMGMSLEVIKKVFPEEMENRTSWWEIKLILYIDRLKQSYGNKIRGRYILVVMGCNSIKWTTITQSRKCPLWWEASLLPFTHITWVKNDTVTKRPSMPFKNLLCAWMTLAAVGDLDTWAHPWDSRTSSTLSKKTSLSFTPK